MRRGKPYDSQKCVSGIKRDLTFLIKMCSDPVSIERVKFVRMLVLM